MTTEGLKFISTKHNTVYYYDNFRNTESWEPYSLDSSKFKYIFGDWERKISKTFKEPYYYNFKYKISQWFIPRIVIVSFPDPGIIPTSSKPFPFDVYSKIKTGVGDLVKAQIFYDILPGMYPEYGPELTEKLLSEKIIYGYFMEEHIKRVNDYIKHNNLKNGDVIYYGTTDDSLPEYGFGIVKRDDDSDEDQFIQTKLFFDFANLYEGETFEENAINLMHQICLENNVPNTSNYEVALKQILLWVDKGIFKDKMFQLYIDV